MKLREWSNGPTSNRIRKMMFSEAGCSFTSSRCVSETKSMFFCSDKQFLTSLSCISVANIQRWDEIFNRKTQILWISCWHLHDKAASWSVRLCWEEERRLGNVLPDLPISHFSAVAAVLSGDGLNVCCFHWDATFTLKVRRRRGAPQIQSSPHRRGSSTGPTERWTGHFTHEEGAALPPARGWCHGAQMMNLPLQVHRLVKKSDLRSWRCDGKSAESSELRCCLSSSHPLWH